MFALMVGDSARDSVLPIRRYGRSLTKNTSFTTTLTKLLESIFATAPSSYSHHGENSRRSG